MKAFTDLEQSKKLAEILPIESADMWYQYYTNPIDGGHLVEYPVFYKPLCNPKDIVPCWSLAALLNIMPLEISFAKQTDGKDIYYYIVSCDARYCDVYTQRHLDIIDACVEMILKLHKLKML